MTKKQVLRAIAFFLAFTVMLVVLCDLFEEENNKNSSKRFATYRSLEEDTVDVVMVGSSGMDRFFIPSQAYEKHGMTVYPMATNSMPVFLYLELIEEVLTYQSPKLLVIDIRPFTQDCENTNKMDSNARILLDVLTPFSPNRIKAGFRTLEAIESVDSSYSSDLSMFLSFIKFHSKWEEDTYSVKNNLGEVQHDYLGFFVTKSNSIKKTPQKTKSYDENLTTPLSDLAEETLYELIDFIKENDLNVLFLDTPQYRNEVDVGRSNKVYSILKEENIDYLHFYSADSSTGISIDFDYSNDFYDTGHTNFYGATKFTEVFADYLNKNYDLADHRNDPDVTKDWDGVQEKLVKKIKEYENN